MTTTSHTGQHQGCVFTPRGLSRRLSARPAGLGRALAGAVTTLAALGVALSGAFSATAEAATTSHTTPAFCQSGGAELWSHLAACGWPGPGNTGAQSAQCPKHRMATAGTSPMARIVVSKPHEVISCERITGRLFVTAPDVHISNVSIVSNSGKVGEAANGSAGITIDDGASATIDHVTINGEDGVHACIWDQGTHMSVNAVDCHGVDDGIWSWADTGYSMTTGDHFTIRNSYFHGFTHRTSNGHEDGYQTEGASHGLIEHNTYLMGATADSAVAIWDGLKSARDITVAGNLMTGGSFTVYAQDYNPGAGGPGMPSAAGGASVTSIRFTDNSFSTYAAGCVGKYGVWFTRPTWAPYHGGPTDGWHRSGNKVLETGENVDAGNPHNGGALCQ
jgi:hypothetical protein